MVKLLRHPTKKANQGKDVLICRQVRICNMHLILWWATCMDKYQSKRRHLCFNVMYPIVDDDTEEESGISANKIVGTDNSASYQFVKRQRRRTSSRDRSRSISITVATFDYSSSGDETIYSAQGNYICKLHDNFSKKNWIIRQACIIFIQIWQYFGIFRVRNSRSWWYGRPRFGGRKWYR